MRATQLTFLSGRAVAIRNASPSAVQLHRQEYIYKVKKDGNVYQHVHRPFRF